MYTPTETDSCKENETPCQYCGLEFQEGLVEFHEGITVRTLHKSYKRYRIKSILLNLHPVEELRTLARPQLPRPEIMVSTHLGNGSGQYPT